MAAEVEYDELYRIQDRVLEAVRDSDTEFYLTGGTCLHRFYLHKRYSDDLDFFTSEVSLYRDDLRRSIAALAQAGLRTQVVSDSRDFLRVMVDDSLQVDFVSDRVHRTGASVISLEGYRLDNLTNVLANKICALTGRDEAKDAFDLWAILAHSDTDPAAAYVEARKKCSFSDDLFEFRAREFPLRLLDELAVESPDVLADVREGYAEAIERLLSAIA